uniref:CCHC-type domain-containing protein n=1 Tax=Fagus sylvatica TaxID=28930 RepID=A0A2N9G5C3_FAGSY
MAEELEELCRRMRLSDHEKHHIRLRKERVSKSHQEAKFSLLFKLHTTRPFNGEAFKRSVRAMWSVHGDMIVSEIDDNLFVGAFYSEAALQRILAFSPWTFDKKLILLTRFVGDLQPSAVKFTHSAFWIRIVNLPIKSMTREVGEDIGTAVGKLLKVEDDKPVWVDFRYEHLPIFCYKCGLLGHSSSDCITSRGGSRTPGFDRDQYGSWLRALPTRHYQAARRQAGAGESAENSSNSNFHGDEGSGGGDAGETESRREDRIEVTSTAINEPHTEQDKRRIPDFREMGDTEKEVLCVPNFMEIQLGGTANGTEVLIENQDLGQKSGIKSFNLDTPSEQAEEILREDLVDSSQRMDAEQAEVHDNARGGELDSINTIGGEVENIKQAEFIEQGLAKAQTRKPTWKKRARTSTSAGNPILNTNHVGLRGKRILQYEEDFASAEEAGNRVKKARSSGVVFNHDSVSVVAVEQPRRRGLGGGLALLWRSSVAVHVQSFSNNHIDADVVMEDGLKWRVTGFYGNPVRGLRGSSWALLRHLCSTRSLPWLVLGDFNEVTSLGEQWGRIDRSLPQMAAFRDVLADCSLQDLGFQGPAFSWSNRREDGALVRARLDRCVANNDWLSLFPNHQVHHVVIAASDHMGLMVVLNPPQVVPNGKRKRLFRFEHIWIRDLGCKDAIKEAWSCSVSGTPLFIVAQKIKNCRIHLLQWSQAQVNINPRLIESKKSRLAQLECRPMNEYSSSEVNVLRREINMLVEKEETFWRQRSRVSWLKGGDRNTKFFHACASQRKKNNLITGLRDEQGVWQNESATISNIAVDYFHNLFASSNPDCIREVVDQVDAIVTPQMNVDLLREFSSEEIHRALFQMSPSKAPGPDGRMLGSINFTNIVLIPKVKNPESMSQFRPISLCNVLYKIIAKVLVNKMKVILPNIISDSQSAFIPGRLISDNVIMAFEVLHYLRNLGTGANFQMAAKLDMSKAYDRVEWTFLQAILLKLGFHRRWVSLIMSCVSSTSFAVMVNGVPNGYIKPSRGLRQGDPLSPYLFLICAEGLSALIRKAEREQSIRGIAICRGGPRISHLFFADDSVIFCRASQHEGGVLQTILKLYERASGQKINEEKTAFFFSKNTPVAVRSEILSMFGSSPASQFEKYLGLPSILGRSKKRAFNEIKDRIWKRLQGWKENLLSQAGREILIKAVVQAIPIYAMSCFKLPAGLCNEICSMANQFWWGKRSGERKIHWVGKHKLIRPKIEGGMGFRDLHLFNKALLARQGWRLLQHPQSLIFRFLKSKYFPHSAFLEAQCPGNASYIWKSICDARQVLRDGLRWRVGNGTDIKIWKDAWLPTPTTFKVISPVNVSCSEASVDSLIDTNVMRWNLDKLKLLFLPRDVAIIKQIPLSVRRPRDKLIWTGTKSGNFTVKSAYNLLLNQSNGSLGSSSNGMGSNHSLWSRIWAAQVPPKVRLFMWRACLDILPTKTKLFDKGLIHSVSCLWCEGEPESSSHILWQCDFAQKIWMACPVIIPSSCSVSMNFRDFILSCIEFLSESDTEILFTTAWEIWNARNRFHWENVLSTVNDIWQRAAALALEFKEVSLQFQSVGGGSVVPLAIRDADGSVKAAMKQRMMLYEDKLQLQALAVLAAVKFAFDEL